MSGCKHGEAFRREFYVSVNSKPVDAKSESLLGRALNNMVEEG
jgi:hypothetical protein